MGRKQATRHRGCNFQLRWQAWQMNLSPVVRTVNIAMACWGAAAACLSAQADEAAVVPTGKIMLFDGKSLNAWSFVSADPQTSASAVWSVRDGVVACAGEPSGYARTLQRYRDYQLHLEWRFPDGPGNSGTFLHINGEDKVWATCLEVQLKSGEAGEIRCNGDSKVAELTPASAIAVSRSGGDSEKAVGEWNRCDIVCRGNTVSVSINGVLQNKVTGASVSAGAIGLQSEGKPVEFRNIVIEPLP